MVNGNIFDAIRRNQELEREKRLAQRESFIDPAIQQVQGSRPISVLSAIQLSRPANVSSQIAKPLSQRQQVATTNISPQEKNLQDLKRAFPPSVSSVTKRGRPTEIELELTTEAGGTRRFTGSSALEERLRSNIQGTSARVERISPVPINLFGKPPNVQTDIFGRVFSFIDGVLGR